MDPEGIGSWPRLRAVKSAGHPAVLFRGTALTYDRLADRVDRLAAALQGLGVAFGDRVAFLGDNHPAFIEALFAVTRLGGIFVPLNTRLAVPELEHTLQDCTPRVLISTSPLEARAAAAAARVPLRRVVVADAGAGDPVSVAADAIDYEHLTSTAPAAPRETPEVSLRDRALIIYTSGTTGKPKGAVLTHGNLLWNALNVLVDYDVVSSDRALMISPLFHVASLGMGCLPMLLKGATVLLEERFAPAAALRCIQDLRATTVSGVPTTFQLMMEDPAWESTDTSSLRLLTCGGSAVPERVRAAYEARGLSFSGGYGMTESSPGITLLPPRLTAQHPGSAGLAHFFTRFRIRDTGSGEVLGPYASGEIEAAGPNVFLEYWGLPEATGAALGADGWLRTGDIGHTDADGHLVVSDRVKDMIISGGENVYSAEVEQALLLLPGVTGAAVIGVPHERWGEVPHAVLTLAPGATLDPEEMVGALSRTLARYKVPRTLEIVPELPRTASGKVKKQELRARYEAGSA